MPDKQWLTSTYCYYPTMLMFATFARRSYVIASATLSVDKIMLKLSMMVDWNEEKVLRLGFWSGLGLY